MLHLPLLPRFVWASNLCFSRLPLLTHTPLLLFSQENMLAAIAAEREKIRMQAALAAERRARPPSHPLRTSFASLQPRCVPPLLPRAINRPRLNQCPPVLLPQGAHRRRRRRQGARRLGGPYPRARLGQLPAGAPAVQRRGPGPVGGAQRARREGRPQGVGPGAAARLRRAGRRGGRRRRRAGRPRGPLGEGATGGEEAGGEPQAGAGAARGPENLLRGAGAGAGAGFLSFIQQHPHLCSCCVDYSSLPGLAHPLTSCVSHISCCFWQERKKATERMQSEYSSSLAGHGVPGGAAAAAGAGARGGNNARDDPYGQPRSHSCGVLREEDEDEEKEAELARLEELHAISTMRIDQLQETLQDARAAAHAHASHHGAASPDGSTEDDEEEVAQRRPEEALDRQLFTAGGPRERIVALRQVCERNLGPSLFEKLYVYLRERLRIAQQDDALTDEAVRARKAGFFSPPSLRPFSDHDVSSVLSTFARAAAASVYARHLKPASDFPLSLLSTQAFRAELRERLGAERFHYVALVDRLLYEEEVLLGPQVLGGR